MTAAVVKILVSSEADDLVGHDVLNDLRNVEVVPYDPDVEELTAHQSAAAVLLPPYRSSHRPIRLLEQLGSLGMVQLLSAGADEWAADVPSAITLATARGAHAGPVSEWVLSAVLTQLRQWPTLVRFQDKGVWAHRKFEADTLAGKRALIVGAGAIGREVARRLDVFGAYSTLVASRARDDVFGPDALTEIVSGHSIVVITAPLTEKTRGLVGSEFLKRMDDNAILVNAGRGQIVDTEALLPELASGRLRAALDVTDPEPLPIDHPLWSQKGAVISPHSARTVPGTNRLCYKVAAQQIAAFLRGERPPNAVEHG
ncbi:phosphoglycerate dehydrogenase [Amycolatopsis sp. NBC_01307]|uniref:NAD(P)-dependent oxidoreductase n=1 Tax=Amycolatopsis sp. NBC_01307 TaxID=2903561 RepID=UPI002E111C3F|nr:phosphoglycerate dehydrogenase [Amycolatopsis sp. NBC_01307]